MVIADNIARVYKKFSVPKTSLVHIELVSIFHYLDFIVTMIRSKTINVNGDGCLYNK